MDVPFVDDYQIFHRAEAFLKKYHPSQKTPVPIEEIAELSLGLTIFPIKRLESGCEVSGTLSKDFKTILIDERTFEKFVERARFTIAHEIGHHILHKDIFSRSGGFNTKEEFIDFQNSLSDGNYKRLEIQAYRFAENILFPKEVFRKVVEGEVAKLGGAGALVITDIGIVLEKVIDVFFVSERAALNKFRREFPGLIESAQSNIPF